MNILHIVPSPYPNTPYEWYRLNPLGEWGSDPILVEGIEAYISIPLPLSNIQWYALDPQGSRIGDPLEKEDIGTGCRLKLSEDHQTIWYELVVAQVG